MPGRRNCNLVRLCLGLLAAGFAPEFAAGQGSRMCAGCHQSIWESYQKTGMGRSFYDPTAANRVEDFTKDHTYYHRPSESYFSMSERNGVLYQRRYQLDANGQPRNVMEKKVDYIMGSGNHARTYLHRTSQNTLVELPLGWYAEKGGYWAMNPGYDRPNHDGFRRPITYDCMFCHNAYPRIPAGHEQPLAEPVYAGPLPKGIDCQRCHGDGGRHASVATRSGTSREEIRQAIMNPARLSAERQLEGCMVCHLETTSFPLPNAIQRYERAAFSYRPGEPLADFLLNFDHAPGSGREDKFEIVNAAYRLRQSACFLKSNGKMLCTTCHNPHDIPRGKEADRRYTAACRQCHSQAFDRLVKLGKHTSAEGCASCHMPKRRTEDVIHVALTDHYIQRQKPAGDLLAELTERQETGAKAYRGRVVPYYPETLPRNATNDLAVAVAQVIQGSNLMEGIGELTAAIEKYSPPQAVYYVQLGDAFQTSRQGEKALLWYRQAVSRDPSCAAALQKLGTSLRRMGNNNESEMVLKRAVAVAPYLALAWHELGLTYRALGKPSDAAAAIGKAVALDPDLAEGHNNLGILRFTGGDFTRAEPAFREAIRIQPDYADAYGNLANLLVATGKFSEALEQFAVALRLRPNDAATHYNHAMLLGRTKQFEEAERELEACLSVDSGFTDAHELLGDMMMARQRVGNALIHYREAIRQRPESERAQLGLGVALAMSGDLPGALPLLRQAAAGKDQNVRNQALEILSQLKRSP